MFTDTFPDDLTIYIFSFLSFSDIAALHVLSHRFHQFLEDHADVLYHQLAVSHRYARKGRLLEEVKNEESRRGGRHLRNVRDWKEFCRESCILNANWTSHGLAIVGGYTNLIGDPNEDALVDFAVDDEHGILLTLISRNSDHSKVLVVRTMDGQRVIWNLPEVTRFVHSGDYFLLWRGRTFMGEVEVWRYVTSPSSPSTTTNSTVTGTFALYATLPTPPGGWRNYAFRAPLLALVNPHQGHLVHLFELPPTPPHLEHPSEPPPKPVQLQAIRLIDLDTLLTTHSSIPDPAERHMLVFSVLLDLQISDKYLCACFDTGLVIARLRTDIPEEEDGESTGKGKATADAQRGQVRKDAIMLEATGQPDDDRRRMPTAQHVFREKRPSTPLTSSSSLPAVGIKYRVRTGWGVMGESMVKERTKEEIEKEESENSNALVRSSYRWNPNFISAQFSPNGKHLVAGTTFRCIYLFTDLDRIFDSAGVSPRDIVQKMAMEEPVRYLKWDTHDTVFALRDDENETWLFDLCPTYHAHPNSHPPDENFDDPPLRLVGARALKVSVFGQPRPFVHGLQVRKTSVWAMSDLDLVLNRRADVASGASVSHRTVCFVGFTDDLKGIL